jgi:hypothetical protein
MLESCFRFFFGGRYISAGARKKHFKKGGWGDSSLLADFHQFDRFGAIRDVREQGRVAKFDLANVRWCVRICGSAR